MYFSLYKSSYVRREKNIYTIMCIYTSLKEMLKLSDIENSEVSPKDLSMNYFKYFKDGRRREYITIRHEDFGEIIAGRKLISKVLSMIGLKISDISSIRDYNDRNVKINDALQAREDNIVISHNDRFAIRIVSTDFVAVPHRDVRRACTQAMIDKDFQYIENLNYDNGMFATWRTHKVENVGDISPQLWAYNRNDGKHSLKIGAGFVVLICDNGVMDMNSSGRVHITHKGELDTIRDRIYEIANKMIDRFDIYQSRIDKAKLIHVTEDQARTMFEKQRLPDHVTYSLLQQWRIEDDTRWGLSQAFSFVGSHYEDLTQNYQMKIMGMAAKVLEV